MRQRENSEFTEAERMDLGDKASEIHYVEGEIEFDTVPAVSACSEGAWVAAWVWVPAFDCAAAGVPLLAEDEEG